MSSREQARRAAQLAFAESSENIVVGDEQQLPMPLTQLLSTTEISPWVRQCFEGGLTARVFRINAGGGDWTLKLARQPALVQNVDGQTSFLNEVQRRRDFQALKSDPHSAAAFTGIVPTVYADYRRGIILSPWIHGEPLSRYEDAVLEALFSQLVNIELHGLQEWDLCPGNILDDGRQCWLFDFGYCYPFDPLSEYNSCGTAAPLFHSIERFETRNLFGYLARREDWSEAQQLALFEREKRLAVAAYETKLQWLSDHNAAAHVLDWQRRILNIWRNGLASPQALGDLYLLEAYRSHLLDLHDDISGKSCTPTTLKRLGLVRAILEQHFWLLKARGGLFFGDEQRSQQELLARLDHDEELALRYQL